MNQPPVAQVIQRLLGCSWGRVLASDDDPNPCMDQATRRAVVYQEGKQVPVQLCPKHMSIVLDESTPHEFDDG